MKRHRRETQKDREFEEFFRAEHARLLGGLLALTRDAQQASDAVQDAFVQAFRHWDEVSTLDKPSAWVRRVAIRRWLDGRRKGGRFRQVELPTDLPGIHDSVADVDLESALESLPQDERIAVVSHYFDDMPIDEIADLVDQPAGTVKWRLSRARARLGQSKELMQ